MDFEIENDVLVTSNNFYTHTHHDNIGNVLF